VSSTVKSPLFHSSILVVPHALVLTANSIITAHIPIKIFSPVIRLAGRLIGLQNPLVGPEGLPKESGRGYTAYTRYSMAILNISP
jgi:hypothetical protein